MCAHALREVIGRALLGLVRALTLLVAAAFDQLAHRSHAQLVGGQHVIGAHEGLFANDDGLRLLPTRRAIVDHLQSLARQDLAGLERWLDASPEQIRAVYQLIRRLDLAPGRLWFLLAVVAAWSSYYLTRNDIAPATETAVASAPETAAEPTAQAVADVPAVDDEMLADQQDPADFAATATPDPAPTAPARRR